MMAGALYSIHLTPGARQHACHTLASILKNWEAEVKAQLEEDVKRGVTEPVPTGKATEWRTRMVAVGKKDGQARRTVDFQRLNAARKR